MQHQMIVMTAKTATSIQNIDARRKHIAFNLVSPVFDGQSSKIVTATKKGASYIARHTGIEGSGIKRHLLLAWFSHNDTSTANDN